jgi:riboflavin synthase
VFTGLIEEVGAVRRVARSGAFQRLEVNAVAVLAETKVGDSININGACQTVVEMGGGFFAVETVAETLRLTTLGDLATGDPVNLERALRLQDRLGGHMVQGHVDGVGTVRSLRQNQGQWLLTIEAPAPLRRYIATKGSITVDGISLTVAEAGAETFTIAVIPHTFGSTALEKRRAGAAVNIEVDVVARYLERLLGAEEGPGMDLDHLRRLGY